MFRRQQKNVSSVRKDVSRFGKRCVVGWQKLYPATSFTTTKHHTASTKVLKSAYERCLVRRRMYIVTRVGLLGPLQWVPGLGLGLGLQLSGKYQSDLYTSAVHRHGNTCPVTLLPPFTKAESSATRAHTLNSLTLNLAGA